MLSMDTFASVGQALKVRIAQKDITTVMRVPAITTVPAPVERTGTIAGVLLATLARAVKLI